MILSAVRTAERISEESDSNEAGKSIKKAIKKISEEESNKEKTLPIQWSPIAALAIRTDVGNPIFLLDNFLRCDKFCLAFFALIEVYHLKKRTRCS
jgi:hypothetical protein